MADASANFTTTKPVLSSTPQNEPKFYTFDDVIRQRAVDLDQVPLVAYPKTKTGVTDYEHFTGAHLNRLIDGAAKALLNSGIEPIVRP